jgi:hypothetical protein
MNFHIRFQPNLVKWFMEYTEKSIYNYILKPVKMADEHYANICHIEFNQNLFNGV